ncbi:hypothetical protein X975_10156, partial [Stegodyphus mimosarum]
MAIVMATATKAVNIPMRQITNHLINEILVGASMQRSFGIQLFSASKKGSHFLFCCSVNKEFSQIS